MVQFFLQSFRESTQKSQLLWLLTCCLFVALMVNVGGITRLTESGLSIVKWEPISGILPPLTEHSWMEEFSLYRESPQYKKINRGMSLSEFKNIYFWEWFHRFLGRFLGMVFFFPFVYFFIRKKLTPYLLKHGIIIFILGGLQGFIGWYMVKSGLVDRPDVSHYRLAMHLLLAFFIIAYIFYVFLNVLFENSKQKLYANTTIQPEVFLILKKLLKLFTSLLVLQIAYGAFLAKLRGGYYYNTFPWMGPYFIPPEVLIFQPWFKDVLENPVTVQFIHRMSAYFLFILGVGITFYISKKFNKNLIIFKITQVWMGVILMQFILGVGTLLWGVPLFVAVLHQMGACFLVLSTTAVIQILYFKGEQK